MEAEYQEYRDVALGVPMTREQYLEWVRADKDATKYYSEIGKEFGSVELDGGLEAMNEKIIPIDSELAVRRVHGLLAKWLQWGVDHGEVIEIVVRKREERRRLEIGKEFGSVELDGAWKR